MDLAGVEPASESPSIIASPNHSHRFDIPSMKRPVTGFSLQ